MVWLFKRQKVGKRLQAAVKQQTLKKTVESHFHNSKYNTIFKHKQIIQQMF